MSDSGSRSRSRSGGESDQEREDEQMAPRAPVGKSNAKPRAIRPAPPRGRGESRGGGRGGGRGGISKGGGVGGSSKGCGVDEETEEDGDDAEDESDVDREEESDGEEHDKVRKGMSKVRKGMVCLAKWRKWDDGDARQQYYVVLVPIPPVPFRYTILVSECAIHNEAE